MCVCGGGEIRKKKATRLSKKKKSEQIDRGCDGDGKVANAVKFLFFYLSSLLGLVSICFPSFCCRSLLFVLMGLSICLFVILPFLFFLSFLPFLLFFAFTFIFPSHSLTFLFPSIYIFFSPSFSVVLTPIVCVCIPLMHRPKGTEKGEVTEKKNKGIRGKVTK